MGQHVHTDQTPTGTGGFRLAMIDVDGTLRDHDDWLPGAHDMLRAVSDAGLGIAVCSGRPVHSLETLFADEPLVRHLAGAGGSVVSRREPDGTWRVLLERTLRPEVVRDVTRACDDLGVEVWAYTATDWLVQRASERSDVEADIIKHSPTVVGSFTEPTFAQTRVLKLLTLPTTDQQIDALDAACRLDGVTLVSSSPGYHDVVPTASLDSKGGDALLGDLGLDWSQVVAIGDGPNDVGMLGLAGLGICLPRITSAAVRAANPNAAHRLVDAADRFDVARNLARWLRND